MKSIILILTLIVNFQIHSQEDFIEFSSKENEALFLKLKETIYNEDNSKCPSENKLNFQVTFEYLNEVLKDEGVVYNCADIKKEVKSELYYDSVELLEELVSLKPEVLNAYINSIETDIERSQEFIDSIADDLNSISDTESLLDFRSGHLTSQLIAAVKLSTQNHVHKLYLNFLKENLK